MRKPCFALNQLYIELKTKSLLTKPSNVLPLHIVFSSSQNSKVDRILPDLKKGPFLTFRTLWVQVGLSTKIAFSKYPHITCNLSTHILSLFFRCWLQTKA